MSATPGLVGRALNDTYRVLELVGEGGFADVFLGRDLRTNVPVAVKILHDHLGRDQSIVNRFLHEARVAQQLSDPHIVRLLDFGLDGDVHYIIMEYVTGHTLAHLLNAHGPMPVDQAVGYISQVLLALADAHRHDVVHRDIKPQNIMVAAGGAVKVMDFGIAKDLDNDAATSAGVLVGTPRYMSPEQARGENATPASDIYALTITFYELLRGQPPFSADTAWKILNLHASAAPPPITDFRSDVPVPIQRIIAKGLAKDPSQRFANAQEMLYAFQHAAMDEPADKTVIETMPDNATVVETAPRNPPAADTASPTPVVAREIPRTDVRPPASLPKPPILPTREPAAKVPDQAPLPDQGESDPMTVIAPSSKMPARQSPTPAQKPAEKPVESPANAAKSTPAQPPVRPEARPADPSPKAAPAWLAADALDRGAPAKRSSLPFLAGGGAIIAALIVGGILLAGRNGPATSPTPTAAPATSPVVATASAPGAGPTVAPTTQPTAASSTQNNQNNNGATDSAGFPTTFGQSGAYQFRASSGVYTLEIQKPQSTAVVFGKPVVADTQISVQARLTDGNAKGSYQLFFRADTEKSGYLFEVDPVQGTFSLARRQNGEDTFLISPTSFTTMNRGGASNQLNVSLKGSSISLTINGANVATLDDGTFPKGQIGLGGRAGDSPATIEYSNLKIGSQ